MTEKMETYNETTPEMYLEMWLSEQIPMGEWLRLLEWRPDIKELYHKHLGEK
tara:strand:+ start:298 stop:453 length:156 start_codon:yes stop_codon:yes gene_type:complete